MPPAGSFIANVAGCRGLTDRGAMQARALAGRLRTTVALAELNSTTWMVTADTGIWIVKAVPVTATAQFNAGLAVAAHLEAAGLRAGAPRITRMGDPSIAMADDRHLDQCQHHLATFTAPDDVN
jgi:hypothetical protein